MSTLWPFCWIGLISCMNWVRITWFLLFWFARRVVESSPFSYLSITQFPIYLSDSSSFSCVFIIWLCFGLSCLIWMPIFGRKFCPVMWAFQSSTMMNGPNWVVHPPDSNAMIRRLFGTTFFPFLQARFRAASADGSSLNTAEFCFGVVFLPFFSLRNYIGLCKSTIAKKFSDFVLIFTIWQLSLLLVCLPSSVFQKFLKRLSIELFLWDFLSAAWWHEFVICHWIVIVLGSDGIFIFLLIAAFFACS